MSLVSVDFRLALTEVGTMFQDPSISSIAAFRWLCEYSAKLLQVERVGVWLLTDERRVLRCMNLYEQTPAVHSTGISLRTEDFPVYFATLDKRQPIPASDAQYDPRTSELTDAYLVPLGITSMLDVPLFQNGQIVGVVCHEHTGEAREWDADERHYVKSLGEVVSLRVESSLFQKETTPESKALEWIGQLSAGVAHDFNNILTVILGYSEMLRRQPELSASSMKSIDQIIAAAERGATLTNDLMLIVRNRARETQVIVPSEVIERAMPMLLSLVAPTHTIDFSKEPQGGRVFLDPSSLERILTNLVVNARDAMPDGGAIAIRVFDNQQPIENHRDKRYKLIEVQDHGTGIAPEIHDKLFEPFTSTKPADKGTGLGLSIVKQIVDRAGGFIDYQTALGQGTTFQVYLPLVSCTAKK
jgi:two-component system, cell cycle sensor histidine kinase and response regulator CckA